MANRKTKSQRGVALFFAVFALFLLTGIAAALILEANTEGSINSNYRSEQVAYFAAKAGVEEGRARMMPADPNTINPGGTGLPTVAPTTANSGIIYIVNNGGAPGSVQPWSGSNAYADDELCHDGYGFVGMTAVATDIRCDATQLPPGTAWYTTYNSSLPFNGTSAALPYKWVRIAPKLNGSVGYLTGSGSTASTATYTVNNNPIYNSSTMVCWDGQKELPLAAGDTQCNQMLSSSNAPMTNVYMVTSLGVGSTSTSARRMIQTEIALNPSSPFPYGLFATASSCPAVTFTGNNPTTDSYTTSGGGNYSLTHQASGGDVGSNGGVSVGNGNIGGIVGVLPTNIGHCATPFSISSNGSDIGPNCPGPLCVPNSASYLSAPYTFPTPPAPNPLPPTTNYNGSLSIVPGTFGNFSLAGNQTLTMAPGTYNINSISMAGNAQITVNPPGAVILNVAGTGQGTPIQIAGNGISDDSNPNDFMINYGGTGGVSVTGNGNVTAILNAPNAALTQSGNGNWYGSILASTMTIGGNAFFHFDRSAALSPPSNGYYSIISYRSIEY
jgi:Tfp pilus assembly protein PilX